MKTVWLAILAVAATPSALAQSTIYKHVDESGRTTYSNKPMKGATVLDLEPLMTLPATPVPVQPEPRKASAIEKASATLDKPELKVDSRMDAKPAVAIVTPVAVLAAIDPQTQKRRDDGRRRILETELRQEGQSLGSLRAALLEEQQNPALVAAVRMAQQAHDPTPSQLAEFRMNIDKASGRIRGLQATVAEHEKNIEALKKELGALKP